MSTFLIVTALTIAFVLGSAMAMRPTPRQRQLARLRQLALAEGLRVQTGEFGAHMIVEIINDGPVTIWMEM